MRPTLNETSYHSAESEQTLYRDRIRSVFMNITKCLNLVFCLLHLDGMFLCGLVFHDITPANV